MREELLIPADAISLAIRQQHNLSSQLPIILWQFGFLPFSSWTKCLNG
ncbi:DUF2949 domain-containing protein [Acaryochloris sp. CCMEE 5410]|nr:DUF2949 domain-containing protein [Acaryochloris sp. CCMEE 5410]